MRAAGAAIVHIHVRDDDEKVTCDPARYARVRDLVEAAGSNVVINMSTGGGAGTSSDEERMAPLALAPEIASYDCGSVNFGERVFINSPTFLRELATRMKTYGVKPEIECFEPGHIWNALRLIDDGLLEPPFWFQFVLGVRGGSPPEVKQLQHMVEMLPAGPIGRSAASAVRSCRWGWRPWPWADTFAPGWRTTSGIARASWPRATRSSWPGSLASPRSWAGHWRRQTRCGCCSGCAVRALAARCPQARHPHSR